MKTDLQTISKEDLSLDDPDSICDNLQEKYTWARAMRKCPQDPRWHAEGDVMTHNKLVLASLFEQEGYGKLEPYEKLIMKAAVILHDVAKPDMTKEIEGGLTSKGHAQYGARMARLILSSDFCPEHRELIVMMVRHHMFPVFFLEREDPDFEIIRMSHQCNNKLLSMLSFADVTGRISSSDCGENEDRITIFRDSCQSLNCYDQPYLFENSHGRVKYFQHPDRYDPRYPNYDSTKFEVTIMCGIPASGKDYWIKKNFKDQSVISLDEIRKDQKKSATDNQGSVIVAATNEIKALLRGKQPFIFNATNTILSTRSKWSDLCMKYGASVKIIYLNPPLEKVLCRNRDRERQVPEAIIKKLFWKMDAPTTVECHHLVKLPSDND